MKIDAENFERLAADAKLTQGSWGDGKETACMMSAIAGLSIDDCVAAGWPKWLAEIGTWIFDSSTTPLSDSRAFIAAAQAFNARGGDPDRLFRDWRLQSVLPEAMASVSHGDEPWRARCRAVVQWCMDNDGQAAEPSQAAAGAAVRGSEGEAAWAAAQAAKAAWAAGAGWSAWAAGESRASWKSEESRADRSACRGRMLDVLYRLMRGDEPAECIAAATMKG
jgi:hypothetical protein